MTLLFSKLIFTFLLSYLIKTEKIINILYSPWANIYSSLANIYSPWLIIYSPRLNKKITYTSTSNTNKPKGENWMNYFTSTQGIFNRLASFLIFPATCPIPIAQ